jgi:transcription antitermination factor NusG
LGKPAKVRDEEIKIIKEWLSVADPLSVSVACLQIGDAIALSSGPFLDQKAIVQEVTNTHYVLVLESLGCVLKMKYK